MARDKAELRGAEENAVRKSWRIKDGVIPDDLRRLMGEFVAAGPVFQADDTPRPPWLEIPEYARTSMGWRMGGGETYMDAFRQWFSNLDEDGRKAYARLYSEPEGWTGFLRSLSK